MLVCALWTAAAAWLSLGTIGFASAAGERIGWLPSAPVTFLVPLAAAVVVVLLLRRGAHAWPLSLLALLALPWLPVPVPPAFLIWSGPIAAAVWFAVILMLAAGAARPSVRVPAFRGRFPVPVRAALVALILFSAGAWRAAPSLLAGDEPHYLVITQSLLLDGDLKIQNNHRRGDYRAYHLRELPPHFQRLGKDGEIYSVHAPGLPALVLPAFAVAGYPGVVFLLILLSAAGSGLAWWVAWLATRRNDAAWFGWAAVTAPITTVIQSFTVFPDGPGGTLALTGVWALLRAEEERRTASERIAPWFWHGLALALLPWLHSRFAAIAGALGALVLLRLSTTRNAAAKAVVFLSVPAVSALLWIGYFIAIYGRPDPSAPYSAGEMGSLAWVPGGLAGLLFDQRFGLLPYAPVVAFGLAGLGMMVARADSRRLGLEVLFVIVPYLLIVTHFAMWWGGWSAPARFFAPVLPLLAPAAAVCWTRVRGTARAVAVAALAFTAFVTAALVTVQRGRLVFNLRDTPALWLDWLSTAADLPQAFPGWTRGGEGMFARDVAIWVVALAAGVVLAHVVGARISRRRAEPTRPWVGLAWGFAIAVMIASTVVWAARGVDGRRIAPAQLHLLAAAAASPRSIVVDLDRLRPVVPADLPRHLRIELTRALTPPGGAGRDDRPLFEVPPLPAGEYRITPVATNPRGWLMVGIGRDLPGGSREGGEMRNPFALHTAPIGSPPETIVLRFPVGIRAMVIRGDEDARQTVRRLLLEPMSLTPPAWDGTNARRAVKYARATVFFLDERSYPEPDAFWIGGARSTAFVLQPDGLRDAVEMLMRNGPVANRITLDVGAGPTDVPFAPGEERRVAVPIDRRRSATRVAIDISGGFRPSEHDSGSRDDRLLGLWVKIE